MAITAIGLPPGTVKTNLSAVADGGDDEETDTNGMESWIGLKLENFEHLFDQLESVLELKRFCLTEPVSLGFSPFPTEEGTVSCGDSIEEPVDRGVHEVDNSELCLSHMKTELNMKWRKVMM